MESILGYLVRMRYLKDSQYGAYSRQKDKTTMKENILIPHLCYKRINERIECFGDFRFESTCEHVTQIGNLNCECVKIKG